MLSGGRVAGVYRKMLLPNYGVFDEKRYFSPGTARAGIDRPGLQIGLTVCEDIWEADSPALTDAPADRDGLMINVSASPYHRGKGRQRQEMLAARARERSSYVALCALVGGQDELVFDGQSMVLDPQGKLVARAKQFEEDLLVVDVGRRRRPDRTGARHRSRRSTGRSAWACATTAARTASGTSCSASPAASTRP